MKTIFILLVLCFSTSLFARSADYVCQIRQYQIYLNLTPDKSTHITLRDMDNHDVVFQAYAKSIKKSGPYTIFYFYPGQSEPAALLFKTEDTINPPQNLLSKIDTVVRGFILKGTLRCRKR